MMTSYMKIMRGAPYLVAINLTGPLEADDCEDCYSISDVSLTEATGKFVAVARRFDKGEVDRDRLRVEADQGLITLSLNNKIEVYRLQLPTPLPATTPGE